jgi:hypothetical protein
MQESRSTLILWWFSRCEEVFVLVIQPHYEQVRTSGADGFTEVPFCPERPGLDRCLRQTD